MENAATSKCLNCRADLPAGATYCPHCGQKNSDGKITIRQFLAEFMDSAFNIDSQFFKTLRHIFIPGRLTIEYFRGKHKSYTHPLRLFFVVAVIHLGIIAIVALNNIQGLENSALLAHKIDKTKRDIYYLIKDFATTFDSEDKGGTITMAFDSLLNFVVDSANVDPGDTSNYLLVGVFDADSLKLDQLAINYDDVVTLDYDELIEKYDIRQYLSKVILKQSIKSMNEPRALIRFGIGNLVWMLFVLLPGLALLMKLLYIRRKHFFVEHLVYLYHWHSFAFVLMSVYLLTAKWLPAAFVAIILLIILGFGFIALKRYYGQGFFKSFAKFALLMIMYMSFLIFLFIVTTLISIMVF